MHGSLPPPEATVCHLRDGARESMGPILAGAVVGFVSAWILFAVMHRFSHMVGGLCPYVVILMVTLIVLSKQAVLVVYGWNCLQVCRWLGMDETNNDSGSNLGRG